jgi:predicted DNA-binding transcriptional regulator AlpA
LQDCAAIRIFCLVISGIIPKRGKIMKNPSTAVSSSVEPEELVSCEKTAKALGVKAQTLANWRSEKQGPRYVKVGRLVYYRRSDICAWLASQIRDPKAA